MSPVHHGFIAIHSSLGDVRTVFNDLLIVREAVLVANKVVPIGDMVLLMISYVLPVSLRASDK